MRSVHVLFILREMTDGIRNAARFGMATVLLVEDEGAIREILQCILERQGYRVLAAGDAIQALEMSGQCEETIDLLLTDANLPGMKGHELAQVVCASRTETKVLFMSGFSAEPLVDTKWPLIEKPFDLPAMVRVVDAMLKGKTA